MRVEPFVCYRPSPDHAATFAAPPYDVFDRASAAAYVASHPASFLEVDRPETGFSPDHDMYAPEVYAHAEDVLHERAHDGTLVHDGTVCYYIYRLVRQGRAQVGIVGACALDDYLDGTIRRHELTRPEKEEDRVNHIRTTGCQTGPILLAYRDEPTMDLLVSMAMTSDPLYDFTDDEGIRQTVWRVARPAAVDALRVMWEKIPCAYIADGHHRAASAARVCREMREQRASEGKPTGNEASDYLLAVLFPASQLTILPYDRVVQDTNGLDEDALVAALRANGVTVGDREDAAPASQAPGTLCMHAFGAWRELTLPTPPADDPVAALDVSQIQHLILEPVLGIHDPTRDPRISYVGGTVTPDELASMAGDKGVALSLSATRMDEIMAVADVKGLMPPKSTWFEPKLRSGLFVRVIDSHRWLQHDIEARQSR